MQEGRLILKRTNQYANRAGSIQLFIDDKSVGYIRNNETKLFDIPEGTHKLAAKIDWCKTKPIIVNINGEKNKEIELGSPFNFGLIEKVVLVLFLFSLVLGNDWAYLTMGVSLVAALPMLYYLTFGSHNYLYLKEK